MRKEDFRLTLTLDVNQANDLYVLLASLPYNQVQFLMEEIRKQFDKQMIPPEDFESDKPETDFPL
jgi:hypothetical protein